MIEQSEHSSAKIVWTYGLLFGIGASLLWLVCEHLALSGGGVWATVRTYSMAGSFLLVGLLASRQTGSMRTGVLAGLVGGFTEGIIVGITAMMPGLATSISLSQIFTIFTMALLGAGAGAFISAFGAVGGSWQYQRKS